jgi:hypothetical protein
MAWVARFMQQDTDIEQGSKGLGKNRGADAWGRQREREEAGGGARSLCGLWVNGRRGSVGRPGQLRKEK